MKIQSTDLQGVFVLDLERISDERGFFARTLCHKEFAQAGLDTDFVQANTSTSHEKGTIRGLHYQIAPHGETRLVRCIQGAVYDVVVDLRQGSPTFGKSQGVTLTQDNHRQVYVPKGFAHGILTLSDESTIAYLVSANYAPQAERGLRWNDPGLAIEWPEPVLHVSDKDASWPDFHEAESGYTVEG